MHEQILIHRTDRAAYKKAQNLRHNLPAPSIEELQNLQHARRFGFQRNMRDTVGANLPLFYARLSDLFESGLEPLFSLSGLLYISGKESQPQMLQPREINSWEILNNAWTQTIAQLSINAFWRTSPLTAAVLHAHWDLRYLSSTDAFERQILGGAGTSGSSMTGLCKGMSSFMRARGLTPEERAAYLIHSSGPIRSLAGLAMSQQQAFSGVYLGEKPTRTESKSTFARDYDAIRDDIYSMGGKAIKLITRPDSLPYADSAPIGSLAPHWPGIRLGCPVIFSPNLVHRLWGHFAHTAIEAGLA